MTYNTNGERQQLVHFDEKLMRQRPNNRLVLFKNFSGYARTIRIWDRFHSIPISDLDYPTEGLVLDNDFTIDNFMEAGWLSKTTGFILKGSAGSGFNFYLKKVPSTELTFATPASTLGQIHATENIWNGMSCNFPLTNRQIVLTGSKSKI